MINKNDIRIGNYLFDNEGVVRRIAFIERGGLTYERGIILSTKRMRYRALLYEDVRPIPLTKEVYSKCTNTAENDLFCWSWNEDSGHFCLWNEDNYGVNRHDILFLHQLQNIQYAFTGIELIYTP